jgi:hypothetical protein
LRHRQLRLEAQYHGLGLDQRVRLAQQMAIERDLAAVESLAGIGRELELQHAERVGAAGV